MNRTRFSLIGFVSLITLLLTTFAVAPVSGSTFRKVKEGDAVPAFTVKDLEGKEVSFTPDDGKVKLLVFASIVKNSKSKRLLKDLNEMFGELSAKGIEVLAVISYEDSLDGIKTFVDENTLKYPITHDADQKAYGDWGLFVLPASAVVDGSGTLVLAHSSHDMEYNNVVGGKAKVLAGAMTEEEYEKLVRPEVVPEKSKEQKDAQRMITLGKRLASKRLHAKAAEKFKEALELDPENIEARTLYAGSLAKAGKVEEALAELEVVLTKDPNYREAKITMGIALIEKGDFDGAVEHLTNASMLNPRPQRAYYWLGNAYEQKGELDKAVKYYRKALKKILGE